LQPVEMLSPSTTILTGCLVNSFWIVRDSDFGSDVGTGAVQRSGAWEYVMHVCNS